LLVVQIFTGTISRLDKSTAMNPSRRRFLGSSSVVLGCALLHALTSPLWTWKRSLLVEPSAASNPQSPKPSISTPPATAPVMFVDVAKEGGLNSPNVWGGVDQKNTSLKLKAVDSLSSTTKTTAGWIFI